MNANKQAYESKKVIRTYKGFRKLLPPEKIIHSLISAKQTNHAMLDLGIGTGRTTEFFAPLFDKYVGIDFSSGMIEACSQRFKERKNIHLLTADAVYLPELPEEKFDFILYSLNGISYLRNIDERILLLKNSYALLNNNGTFAFSAHNTKALKSLYSFQWPRRNPVRIITEYFRQKNLRKINGQMSEFEGKSFFQLYDGGEYFKVLTSYILPSFQISLLQKTGFNQIKLMDFKGKDIPLANADEFSEDRWMIYYVCSKN